MFLPTVSGTLQLQATLAAGSCGMDNPKPHHPITCHGGELELDEDGFRCPHAAVPADDERTRSCIDQSVAILLFEVLARREGRC